MGLRNREKNQDTKANQEIGIEQTALQTELINGAKLLNLKDNTQEWEQHAQLSAEERFQEYKEATREAGASEELQDIVSQNLTDQKTSYLDGFYATIRATYEKVKDSNTRSYLKGLEERFTEVTKQKEELGDSLQTRPEQDRLTREQEALASLISLVPKLESYNKAMYAAGYTDEQIQQFNIKLRTEYIEAYTTAREEGLSATEAAEQAKEASEKRFEYNKAAFIRKNNLTKEQAQEDKNLQAMDASAALMLDAAIPITLAIEKGNAEAILAVQDAESRGDLRKAIEQYELMQQEEMERMFSATDLALQNGLLLGVGELTDAEFEIDYAEAFQMDQNLTQQNSLLSKARAWINSLKSDKNRLIPVNTA